MVPCDKDGHMFVPGFAVVANVFADSVASQAGVLPGDVLVAVNG